MKFRMFPYTTTGSSYANMMAVSGKIHNTDIELETHQKLSDQIIPDNSRKQLKMNRGTAQCLSE